jgi:protein SCO1
MKCLSERRRVLALMGSLVGFVGSAPCRAGEAPTGWVQPRPATPELRIIDGQGRRTLLAAAVAGRVTAVQLMFTGCSSTCPIQGALFAALAARQRTQGAQFLSVSIDALGDTPAALANWQARLGPQPAWRTAVAEVNDVDRLATFLKGAHARSGTHTAQVFVFDALGRLAYRTGDSPGVAEVEALMARVTQIT